ncbi:HNH endonuclease [Mesorhizobium sp. B2-8-5]|uniref:HNH endonuclease n=1 Tax=Mesorhizobium sp. B2-8-5 TaxID=2589903 RepID=UPI001126868F|nr:HNH endonuclease [Mesorhizobium sp. B2-8-5]UCI25195.1 HNH endonuclease [Mesorhizobium sp. B2-8-5]
MTDLLELEPKEHHRTIDLVARAGVNVDDWANFKGGVEKAAANPKYCYEWSFVEVGKVVVLNLWFDHMLVRNGLTLQEHNQRARSQGPSSSNKERIWKARAARMDEAIRTAYDDGLPIRVIICSGSMRTRETPDADASKVKKRLLDPVAWAVTAYDPSTGQCTIARGATPRLHVTSLPDAELEGFEGAIKRAFVRHRHRERELRANKIDAAMKANKGRLICEVPNCGFDFFEVYGAIGQGYAQVHHKIPISSAPPGGMSVRLDDLAIVCANCHAMIHHRGGCRPLHGLIPER